MKNEYELETLREIWPNNGYGEHLEIGPDRDGLGIIEIRQKEPDNTISSRIYIDPKCVYLVIEALKKCSEEILDTSE